MLSFEKIRNKGRHRGERRQGLGEFRSDTAMTQAASFPVDPHNVLAEKIGRPDVRSEALSDVKDSLRRYIAFRQDREAEDEMAERWFVGAGGLCRHDNIETIAEEGMAFHEGGIVHVGQGAQHMTLAKPRQSFDAIRIGLPIANGISKPGLLL